MDFAGTPNVQIKKAVDVGFPWSYRICADRREGGGGKGGFGLPKARFSSRRVRQAEVARYDSAMSQGVK